MSLAGMVAGVTWFFGAVIIATDLLHVGARRGNLWVVVLIFASPFVVVGAVADLVQWIKGPRSPGRHARDR